MKQAKHQGRLIPASPDAPDVARCPACEGAVRKRRRRRDDGEVTWFWRHRVGEGDDCPLRYRPTAE